MSTGGRCRADGYGVVNAYGHRVLLQPPPWLDSMTIHRRGRDPGSGAGRDGKGYSSAIEGESSGVHVDEAVSCWLWGGSSQCMLLLDLNQNTMTL